MDKVISGIEEFQTARSMNADDDVLDVHLNHIWKEIVLYAIDKRGLVPAMAGIDLFLKEVNGNES